MPGRCVPRPNSKCYIRQGFPLQPHGVPCPPLWCPPVRGSKIELRNTAETEETEETVPKTILMPPRLLPAVHRTCWLRTGTAGTSCPGSSSWRSRQGAPKAGTPPPAGTRARAPRRPRTPTAATHVPVPAWTPPVGSPPSSLVDLALKKKLFVGRNVVTTVIGRAAARSSGPQLQRSACSGSGPGTAPGVT